MISFLSVLGLSFLTQGVWDAFQAARKDGYAAGIGSLSGFVFAVGTLYGLYYLLVVCVFA